MATNTATTEKIDWSGGSKPFKARYGKLMMWYFLLSDAFTFTTFLVTYGLLRFSSNHWPDPNDVFSSAPFGIHNAPLGFVSFMTFTLILSSVFVVLAVIEGHRLNKNGVLLWMGLGIIGGIIFLGSQAWEWSHLKHEGLWFDKNTSMIDTTTGRTYFQHTLEHMEHAPEDFKEGTIPEKGNLVNAPKLFTSLFFFITGFHGLHVLSGIILNIIAWVNTAKGVYDRKKDYEMIEKMGLYWHFVDLVWVFVFLCFYLL